MTSSTHSAGPGGIGGPVAALRSISISLPDLQAAETFFVDTWRLAVVARSPDAIYLRGTGTDHHLLALHRGPTPAVLSVTFRVRSRADLDAIRVQTVTHGGRVVSAPAPVQEPGGGHALVIQDPQGRILRFVHGDLRHAPIDGQADSPERLAHVVMNSVDVAAGLPFYEKALGFKLSDRTRIMAFIRVPQPGLGDHHSIALADADNNCLNHVAFVMPSLDAVMRGGGRMKDAGYAIEWGPGRHGPGDNAFNYFIGPAGFVIEYTAEVEQIDDHYRTGMPEDWKWPPGRVDQWGISQPPSTALKQAQRMISFVEAF